MNVVRCGRCGVSACHDLLTYLLISATDRDVLLARELEDGVVKGCDGWCVRDITSNDCSCPTMTTNCCAVTASHHNVTVTFHFNVSLLLLEGLATVSANS